MKAPTSACTLALVLLAALVTHPACPAAGFKLARARGAKAAEEKQQQLLPQQQLQQPPQKKLQHQKRSQRKRSGRLTLEQRVKAKHAQFFVPVKDDAAASVNSAPKEARRAGGSSRASPGAQLQAQIFGGEAHAAEDPRPLAAQLADALPAAQQQRRDAAPAKVISMVAEEGADPLDESSFLQRMERFKGALAHADAAPAAQQGGQHDAVSPGERIDKVLADLSRQAEAARLKSSKGAGMAAEGGNGAAAQQEAAPEAKTGDGEVRQGADDGLTASLEAILRRHEVGEPAPEAAGAGASQPAPAGAGAGAAAEGNAGSEAPNERDDAQGDAIAVTSTARGGGGAKQGAQDKEDSFAAGKGAKGDYALRTLLTVIDMYNVQTLVMAPCSDPEWLDPALKVAMRMKPDFRFTCVGADVGALRRAYGGRARIEFVEAADWTARGALPAGHLLFSRDALQGLPLERVVDALEAMARSGAELLLLGSHARTQQAATGGRTRSALNLQQAPLSLDEPLVVFSENTAARAASWALPDRQLLLFSGGDLRALDWGAVRARVAAAASQ